MHHIQLSVYWFQITRRYAEFSSAIVSINQTFPNERTNALLGQLQVTHNMFSQNISNLHFTLYLFPPVLGNIFPHKNVILFFFQIEVENFVLKMAAEFPSRRDQLIFLINNYDMMLSVLMVSWVFTLAYIRKCFLLIAVK